MFASAMQFFRALEACKLVARRVGDQGPLTGSRSS